MSQPNPRQFLPKTYIKKLHWHKIYDAYQIDDTILYNERKELN